MPPDFLSPDTLPIIQAPMAGAQGSALAVAVSKARAVGSLPCAMLTPDGLRQELAVLHTQAPGPFNVNFFCHAPPQPNPQRMQVWLDQLAPYYAELGIDLPEAANAIGARAPFDAAMAEVLEERPPAIVSFHFGLPTEDLLRRVKAMGAQVWSSATTVAEAQWLQQRGADAVIAQGLEAGGHRGHFLDHDLSLQMGAFSLLPQVVHAVSIPVIAAGGIATASEVRAAMALGASAVQVGTSFLCCAEATTTPLHRAALLSDSARHTALTNLFTGRPARGIVNRYMRALGLIHPQAPEFPLGTAASGPLRAAAEAAGSAAFSPLWCGQNASGCREVAAADIVAELARGLETA